MSVQRGFCRMKEERVRGTEEKSFLRLHVCVCVCVQAYMSSGVC